MGVALYLLRKKTTAWLWEQDKSHAFWESKDTACFSLYGLCTAACRPITRSKAAIFKIGALVARGERKFLSLLPRKNSWFAVPRVAIRNSWIASPRFLGSDISNWKKPLANTVELKPTYDPETTYELHAAQLIQMVEIRLQVRPIRRMARCAG